jgi:autotransporter-associated beta strand protein
MAPSSLFSGRRRALPAVSIVFFAGSAFAQTGTPAPYVGVQFVLTGPALQSTDVAGVLPQSNFNPVFITAGAGTSGTTPDLSDINGNTTPVTLTHTSNDGFHTLSATNSTNGILLRGEDKSGSGGNSAAPGLTATYTFNNVPNGAYDVVGYIENDQAGVNANITVGSITNYVTDQTVSFVTPPFALANSSDPTNRVTGNYVEFFDVVPVAGAITLTNTSEGGGNNTAAINGLQLVQDQGTIWTGGGADNNWSTAANWGGSAPVPPSPLAFAGSVQLNNNNDFSAGTQFNGLTFAASAGAFVLGGNAINLGGDIVNQSANSQTIGMSLALQQNANINAAAGNVSIGGNISGAFSITSLGSGTVTLTGASNAYSGGTNVNGSRLVIAAAGALPAGGGVNIVSGTLALGPGTGAQTLSSLSISPGGTLDIANNQIILSYGASDPIASIYAELRSGYAGGSWTGPGINSSIAALPANINEFAVGVVDGADGVPGASVSSGQILISYALYGDANLDGVVNGTDFAIVAGNFGKSVLGWDQGDFDYDGVVDGTDFGYLAANFGRNSNGAMIAQPASAWAALDFFAAAHGLLSDVPEPSSLSLATSGAIGFLGRRRRM